MSFESQFVISQRKPLASSRLFCFPHAGGGPIAFFDWSERLGPEIECVCLQYPGRGSRLRERPLSSVRDLVDEIGKDIPKIVEKPFTFYGHSFGGVIAFEVTRMLRNSGLPQPNQLFVGASRAPHVKPPFSSIRQLPDDEFVQAIQTRYGGIPEVIYRSPEMLEVFLPPMRADLAAYETYCFQSDDSLDMPISAFAGADDRAVTLESMQEWASHTRKGFDFNVLPGGHFFPTVSAANLVSALQTRIITQMNRRNSTLAS